MARDVVGGCDCSLKPWGVLFDNRNRCGLLCVRALPVLRRVSVVRLSMVVDGDASGSSEPSLSHERQGTGGCHAPSLGVSVDGQRGEAAFSGDPRRGCDGLSLAALMEEGNRLLDRLASVRLEPCSSGVVACGRAHRVCRSGEGGLAWADSVSADSVPMVRHVTGVDLVALSRGVDALHALLSQGDALDDGPTDLRGIKLH